MPSFVESPDSHYDKPVPRPQRSPAKSRNVRAHNRRREYLHRNPSYLESSEHQLADPLLYDTLIRKFQTPAEREAEGRAKSYSRVLEESLLRGEARLADLKSPADGAESTKRFTTEADLSKPTTKEDGLERWNEFLTERFVHGGDVDFDYNLIDNDDDLDTVERRDAEDAWFDAEDPAWASDNDADAAPSKQGETGIQDF